MRSVGTLVALVALCAGAQALTYDDATDAAGVRFQLAGETHADDDVEWPALPEIMGAGACWADFDGDGYDDLYLVNQQFNPENPGTEGWIAGVDPTGRLYLNAGDGTFTDATVAAGVESRRFGYGCSAADYDGDLDVDLFVAVFGDDAWGGNHLYRNNGDATFVDVGEEAGVSMLGSCGNRACMATSSAWGDYDLDGDLDLYVATYVRTTLTDLERGPAAHVAQVNWLFQNEGDGTFAEVGEAAGVAGNPTDNEGAKSLGVAWFDHDLDGDLDLYVANDEEPNDFYENNGDGTFTERSEEAGLADGRAGMGLTVGDYDNDGYPDLFFTHFQDEHHGFYRNRGDGTYEDRSGEDDLGADLDRVGWGTSFLDIDRDGDLDILVANGHTEPVLPDYAQPMQVFRNDPPLAGAPAHDRVWTDVSDALGDGPQDARVTRGLAVSDYDLDGDTDLVRVNNANGTAQILAASGVTNHHLTLHLRQSGPNAHGIGARVVVEAGALVQTREVQAGSSYLSQNSLALAFGLGSATSVDRITVHWPGGGTTVVEDVTAPLVGRIDRATGALVTDTLSPLTAIALDGVAGIEGWHRSPVSATIAASDRGISSVSGVASTERRIGSGAWTTHDGSILTFTDEGAYELRARSIDAAGNMEPHRVARFGVDLTPPTLAHTLEGTAGANGWWVGPAVTVTLEGADALSGVHLVEARVDGGAWTPYDGTLDVSGEGLHAIEARASDRAGNEGALLTFEIAIDSAGPDASLEHPAPSSIVWGENEVILPGDGHAIVLATAEANGLGGHEVDVVALAADATSGVAHVAFVLDDAVVFVDHEGPERAWTWDTSRSSPGLHRLEIVAVDAAGNVAVDSLAVVLVGLPGGPASDASPGPFLAPSLAAVGLAVARRKRDRA